MDIAQDVRDRVIAAATALYEEAARAEFPKVADVRSRAGVDMNAASAVMRDWRQAQTTKAAPLVVDVPEKVKASSLAALGALWSEAQTVANQALGSAQAAWEAERAEAETLREQVSSAFDMKAAELQAAQASLDELAARAKNAETRLHEAAAELARAIERAGNAEARAIEIERRADGLGAELSRVHAQAKDEREQAAGQILQLQAELKTERQRADDQALQAQSNLKTERESHTADLAATRAELDRARTELSGVKAKADADAANHAGQQQQKIDEANRVAERLKTLEIDLDTARQALASAREDAATLRGELKAFASLQAEITRLAMNGRTVQGEAKPK